HRLDLHLRADDGRVRHRAGDQPGGRHHGRRLHPDSDRRHPVPAGGGIGGAARIHPDPGRVRDHPLLEPARGHLMSSSAYAPAMERTQDSVVKRQYKPKRDWAKWGLATYFVIFLIFLYAPMILMAILSFQGYQGGVTFPFSGPAGLDWWRSIFVNEVHHGQQVIFTNADGIRTAGEGSLWVSLAAGAIVAFLAFTLSMAFRRRFRGDGVAFYIILLALMTPGFLLGLGTQIFWKTMNQETSLWHTALGTNTVWGIPFVFLVMTAIWNRYDDHIDEAARDLGANAARTFGEVTLPLVWTGIFGAFLFGFTLTWNDFDRTALLVVGNLTLPLEIVGLIQAAALRPDLYALGTATTLVSLAVIVTFLVVLTIRSRFRRAPVQSVEEELGLGGGID